MITLMDISLTLFHCWFYACIYWIFIIFHYPPHPLLYLTEILFPLKSPLFWCLFSPAELRDIYTNMVNLMAPLPYSPWLFTCHSLWVKAPQPLMDFVHEIHQSLTFKVFHCPTSDVTLDPSPVGVCHTHYKPSSYS